MAVLGRLLVSSAERIDLPDLLSIDSYAAGDWKFFMDTLVGEDTPYIIKGFDIIDPASAIGTQNVSINIADSAMYYPGSGAGSFYYGLPAGNPNALPLVPELRKSATNYVYLTLTTFNTSEDTRAFWDPDANGGNGGEFTQEVNTESVIQVQANVSTGGFPDNTVPVAIVVVGPSVIISIEDARPLMFRLGTGGIDPNPSNRFAWPALPTSAYERNEPPDTISSSGGVNPFQGGDKNIDSLKEWMDAVMSKLAELGGTQYWYEDTSTFSVVSVFHDALATTFQSKGQYIYSSSVPGQLQYTEDVLIISVSDPRYYILRAGTINIPNLDVAYLALIRAQPINPGNEAVSWVNGQAYINTPNGAIGFFANLNQGDWITKLGDDPTLFLRVEQFQDTINGGGSSTTPANAKSIILSAAYQGGSAVAVASYDKGVYQYTDLQIQSRADNPAITDAGGNFLWFALRDDIIEGIASITTTTLSGTLSAGTGTAAEVVSTAHGLINGDYVTITAPTNYAGTYSVEVADANTFYIPTSVTAAPTPSNSLTAFYGLLTTAATTNGYGLQLQSADHGFSTGDTISIAGTTNYNGTYVVSYRSPTVVEFAIGAAEPSAGAGGSATLSVLAARTEQGITKIVQGETIDIGELDSANIQSYVGMPSLAVTSPTYIIPSGYNTFSWASNYNGGSSDNLTLRAAQLTAMMADKAQDKTIKYLCNANTAINTTSGSAQQLTFQPASSTLVIAQPGSPGNATISLPSSAPGISLLANQSAYVYINRNAPTTPTINVADTTAVPVDENVFVIASTLTDGAVYLWNGERVVGSAPLTPGSSALVKVTYFDPISTTLPIGTVTEDGFTVMAGDTVLFAALSSGNNEIYMANGTGSTITSWTPQFAFSGNVAPSNADTAIVQAGTAFQDQIGKFNGTTWVFNDKVRYFNINPGVSFDYFEQDAIANVTLADNTVNGTVFSIQYTGSEYMIIDFSIHRAVTRETGTLYVTTDGTNVIISESGSYIGSSGVSFTGTISGGNLNLLYTTTSTGSSASMKFMIRRWSDLNGGPAGIPSYTPAAVPVEAAGPAGAIQFNGSPLLDGSADFLISQTPTSSSGNGAIVLDGLAISTLSSAQTIVDNTSSPTALFSYVAATYPFAIIEYSIVRNGNYRTSRLMIANDSTITSFNDDYVETNPTGVTISTTIVGSNVVVMYTSTVTGFNGTLKYSVRSWS